MRKTEKQAGAISLALVLGTILLVWTALLAATSEPAGAQDQKAQSEEIRMTGSGGNELIVTADRVTITSDDVVVTKEARDTGQVQDSSGVVGDEEGGPESEAGSDETATSPEDSLTKEAAPGRPADGDDAATEGERVTAGGGTTNDGSSTEESLSEEGPKPEALLRMALEECAVVVSEDGNVPDNDPSEKAAPEETTATETSTTDKAADGEQPSEGSAEETVSEEQRDSDKEATPAQTPEKKTAHEKKDGKKARHVKKDPETIPVANENPTGTEEVVPEETTTQETTGEATAREAQQAGDSATDTTPAEEMRAKEEVAEEETTTTEEGVSEKEDDETRLPDGPALGLTQGDCEKMFAVIAEYNELYDTPAAYDNDETAQQKATPESESAEGESTEDDDGVEGEYAEGRTGEGTTPGGTSREERLARPQAADTEEVASTEEAKEETTEETAPSGQGSRKGSGFAFRPEEEPEEDIVTAPPEDEPVSGDEEQRAPVPAEQPAGSRTAEGDAGAVGETTSERAPVDQTTTGAAEKAPASSSWGQRSSTTKNIALPEEKTPNGTRAVLPKTGGPSLGALAPVAALTAGLPLGAILGVLSLGAGTVLVGFARYRRDSSSAVYSRNEQDEGDSFRRDG